jgi:hypothetical protein
MSYKIKAKKHENKQKHPLYREDTERMFKMIVPTYDNSENLIKLKERDKISRSMADHFGGVTIQEASGLHIENGKYQGDKSIIFISGRDIEKEDKHKALEIFRKDKAYMRRMAKNLSEKYGQESILIEDDIIGDVKFVEGVKKPTAKRKYLEKK